MTWKAYATVSGATVLAGWLASAPPANAPGSASSTIEQASQRATPASDIEQEALRLQARVRRETSYAQPQRNPFRFSAGRPAGRTISIPPRDVPGPRTQDDTLAPEGPPSPAVSLSGIAEDQVGQRLERTAILSSPAGVLLVHEGDDVLGYYRVAKVESEAVELVKLSDGATLRLSLTSPKSQ